MGDRRRYSHANPGTFARAAPRSYGYRRVHKRLCAYSDAHRDTRAHGNANTRRDSDTVSAWGAYADSNADTGSHTATYARAFAYTYAQSYIRAHIHSNDQRQPLGGRNRVSIRHKFLRLRHSGNGN